MLDKQFNFSRFVKVWLMRIVSKSQNQGFIDVEHWYNMLPTDRTATNTFNEKEVFEQHIDAWYTKISYYSVLSLYYFVHLQSIIIIIIITYNPASKRNALMQMCGLTWKSTLLSRLVLLAESLWVEEPKRVLTPPALPLSGVGVGEPELPGPVASSRTPSDAIVCSWDAFSSTLPKTQQRVDTNKRWNEVSFPLIAYGW